MSTITVSHLGKAYKQYPSHLARLLEWTLPGNKARHKLRWIFKDLNFTVNKGEAVGIIGVNGIGKSTLLKIITGVTTPSSGEVKINGKLSALLELGIGFHPDFTGRQNVFLSGQLLGYTTKDIKRLMPEIEDFADIGDYIDQPVRTYSSGMHMRLAFSISTAIRPDILIVDEALSVGDAYFQHKSFKRIKNFCKQGTTLLLVSHDKNIIQSICDRAILLNNGGIAMEGKPREVLDLYNAMLANHQDQSITQESKTDGEIKTISGTGEAKLTDIALLNENNEVLSIVKVAQAVKLCIIVQTHSNLPELNVGYMIKDRFGHIVFGTNTYHMKEGINTLSSGQIIKFNFNFLANLGQGTYSISVALHAGENHIEKNYEWQDLALVFEVINANQNTFIGTGWLPPTLECIR